MESKIMYREPIEPERGTCDVRTHESKDWETGYNIFGWRDDHTVMVKRACSKGIFFYNVSDVRVIE